MFFAYKVESLTKTGVGYGLSVDSEGHPCSVREICLLSMNYTYIYTFERDIMVLQSL